jgi:organic radical activating enzyme
MTEGYKPTPQEIVNSKFQEGMLKVSGDGIFQNVQGEGVSIGKPAVFLRLQDCNLTCGRPSGWQCDTPYTWQKDKPEYWKEPKNIEPLQLAKNIRDIWKGGLDERLVITGGEPMLQQKNIVKLVQELPDWNIEIETNGTIEPINQLKDVQFNVSPKMSNSGNFPERRYKPQVLKHLNELPKTNFKFVVANPQDIQEISHLVRECNLDKDKIYIMPEGITVEALQEHKKLVEEYVKFEGYKMTKRLQIELWGQARRK